MLPARLGLLAILGVTLPLVACVGTSDSTDEAGRAIDVAKLEAYLAAMPADQEIVVIDGDDELPIDTAAAASPVFHHELIEQYYAPQSAFGICNCTTDACLDTWADQQAGCGYCMVFLCDSQPQHVCIPCDDP
jgi:hypothetical protein